MKKLGFVLLMLLSLYNNIFSQSIVWKQLASLPEGFRNGEAVALNNKIYYIPGFDSAVNYNNRKFFMYDPGLNSWVRRADLPSCKANFALAEVMGKLYAIGGDPFLSSNYAYSPESDSWTALSSMPTGRQHIDCGVYDNKIFVMGGITSWSAISKKNEVYDVVTNSWSQKTNVPSLRNNPAIVTLDSLIYVIGGSGSAADIWSPVISTVECYNTQTDTWIKKSDLPFVLFKPYTVVVNNQILVMGGSTIENGQEVCSDKTLLYNAVSDKWIEVTPLPLNIKVGFSAASIGNKIYVIGGMDCTPPNVPLASVYEGELTVTDVKEQNENIPKTIYLYPNFPNPFNPTTTIRYSIPFDDMRGTKKVTLKIYDVLGSEIKTLVDGYKSAGLYEAEFDAGKLTSGVYFYKLTAGNYMITRKMALIR